MWLVLALLLLGNIILKARTVFSYYQETLCVIKGRDKKPFHWHGSEHQIHGSLLITQLHNWHMEKYFQYLCLKQTKIIIKKINKKELKGFWLDLCHILCYTKENHTLQFLSECFKNNVNFKGIFRLDGIIMCIRTFSMLLNKTQRWILHSHTAYSNSRIRLHKDRSRDMQSSERWNKVTHDSPDATSNLCFFRLKGKWSASPASLSHIGREGTWRPKKGWGWGCLGVSVITFLCLVPAYSTCPTGCQWPFILGEFPSYFLL